MLTCHQHLLRRTDIRKFPMLQFTLPPINFTLLLIILQGQGIPRVFSVIHLHPLYQKKISLSQISGCLSMHSRKLHLRIPVLAPLVELIVNLSRESNVGNDNDVEGAGSVPGFLGEVAARVVLVLADAVTFPGHAALGDGYVGFGGGMSGRSAYTAQTNG